jgi:hypothetical protein
MTETTAYMGLCKKQNLPQSRRALVVSLKEDINPRKTKKYDTFKHYRFFD